MNVLKFWVYYIESKLEHATWIETKTIDIILIEIGNFT